MPGSLRFQFREVHRALSAESDCAIASAAAAYAVVLVAEDVIVNGVLDDSQPLALSTWRARTGLSELPPIVSQTTRRAWAARVRVDVSALRAYANAVYLATDAYFACQADRPPAGLTARVLVALLVNQRRLLAQQAAPTVC